MTTPSPTCLVNGASTINGVAVSAGATVTIQLADTTGVVTWDIRCISTDELHTTSSINAGLTITDPIAKTAQFTAPAGVDGSALIFQSTVNGGVDLNGRTVAAYRTTFKIKVLVGTLELIATNETTEGNAAYGWTASVNAGIRAIATGGGGGGSFTAGGDLSGTASSQTVEKIKGTTVTTAGGALPVGAVLRTTAAGTADWGAVDLADADAITGELPVANGGTGLTSISGALVQTTAAQTLTNKTLTTPIVTSLTIPDSDASHNYVVVSSNISANRNITLPALTGNDTFVFAAASQTLTNKTLTSPTIGGTPNFGSVAITTTGNMQGASFILGASGPTITSGTGAPATSPPNGSIFLRTDGTGTTGVYTRQAGAWSALGSGGSGGTPGGSDTEIQFNDGGGFGGDAGFTYNKTSDVVSIAGGVELGSGTKPAAGLIRIAYDGASAQNIIVRKDSTNADVALFKAGAGDSWTIGDTTHSGFINAYALQIVSLSSSVQAYASGGFHFYDYSSARYGASIQGNGVQIGNTITGDFGGGVGVIGIKDASTVPTTNPTGGVILYSEGGALKFRNPSGTVTTIGFGGGGFTAGGDLSGTSTSQTVDKIKGTTITTAGGALPVGAVLRTTAVGTADWGAVDLADTDAVTGTLPVNRGGTGITSLGTGVATFLGTPSGANLASALTTALPATKGGTGLTSLGTGVATWLGTPSSANLAAAITDETGSGALVFGTSPTLSAPTISDHLIIGSTTASTGTIRLANATTIAAFRNGTNASDKIVLASNSFDELFVGTSGAYDNQAANVRIYAAGSVMLGTGATTVAQIDSTVGLFLGTGQPIQLGTGGPKLTTGTGAPAASDPNGSLYLRSDGTSTTTAYVRAAGAWSALGGGGGSSDRLTVSGTDVLVGASTTQLTQNATTVLIDGNTKTKIRQIVFGPVYTTNATVTNIFTYTIPSNCTINITVKVTAHRDTNAAGAVYFRSMSFRNAAGTVTAIGTVADQGTYETTAGWDCTINNSTTTIQVRGTGAASTNIAWGGIVEIQEQYY